MTEGRQPLPRLTQVRIVGVAALAIVVLLLLVNFLPRWFRPSEPPQEAPPPAGYFRPTPEQWQTLSVAPVKAVAFRPTIVAEGKVAVDDNRSAPVISPYSGRITRIYAREGQHVAQGDPLFAVAAQEYVQAENDLITAVAGLATARQQLDLARVNEKRQEALYEARGGALKDLQQSQADLAAAEGAFRTAEIAVVAVRDRLRIFGKSDADIDAMARAQPGSPFSPDAVVSAPLAGYITQRQIAPAENIVGSVAANGSATPLFTVSDLSVVWVLGYIGEEDAARVREGDEVSVRVAAFPGRTFAGRLNFVAATLDPTLHRLFVRAEVENPGLELKPEMFAQLQIQSGPAEVSPAVPAESVIFEGSDARVWAVGPDHSVGLREIVPGIEQDGLVQVRRGVAEGDSVISAGSLFIDRAAKSEQ